MPRCMYSGSSTCLISQPGGLPRAACVVDGKAMRCFRCVPHATPRQSACTCMCRHAGGRSVSAHAGLLDLRAPACAGMLRDCTAHICWAALNVAANGPGVRCSAGLVLCVWELFFGGGTVTFAATFKVCDRGGIGLGQQQQQQPVGLECACHVCRIAEACSETLFLNCRHVLRACHTNHGILIRHIV